MPHIIEVVSSDLRKRKYEKTQEEEEETDDDDDDEHFYKIASDTNDLIAILVICVPPEMRPFMRFLVENNEILNTSLNQKKDLLQTFYNYFSLQFGQQHPQKMKFEDRVLSYNPVPIWPLSGHLSPERMALWGFFRKEPYEKQHTCCFACGCVLSDWVDDDNPYVGHSQYRPQCPWIGLVVILERTMTALRLHPKCQQEAKSVFPSPLPLKASSLRSGQTKEIPEIVVRSRLQRLVELSDNLDLPMTALNEMGAQAVGICRDVFGYHKGYILYVIWRKLFRYYNTQKIVANPEREATIELKHLYSSSVMLIKDIHLHLNPSSPFYSIFPKSGGMPLIEDIKELLLYEPPAPQVQEEKTAPSSPKPNTIPTVPSCGQESSSSGSSSFPASQPAKWIKLGGSNPTGPAKGEVSESAKRAMANKICVKCMRKRACFICLPCKHFAICESCSKAPPGIKTCPACNVPVTDLMRVYPSDK